jgi:small subunit ribosomal protein S6
MSTDSTRTYELVLMLDADAPTDTRTKIVGDAQTLLSSNGDLKASKEWGTRQLPYLIDHHEEAAYTIFQFTADPAAIATIDRALKLTEGVLRFRIFETEEAAELPENPPTFKREERGYERPPREARATAELDDEPTEAAPAPEQPSADPVGDAVAAEQPAAEEAAPAEAPAEESAETPAEAPAPAE